MNNTINQSWEIVEALNSQTRQTAKEIKRGEARIAEANHLKAKDQILPCAGESRMQILSKGKAEGKPELAAPKGTFAGLKADDVDANGQSEDGKTLGLIAIIGEVMALQAKTNSNFWSTLWKQSSESMQMEVEFAPIIGDAIKDTYNAMADATKTDADCEFANGWTNLSTFAGGAIAGGISEYKENSALEDSDINTKNETDTDDALKNAPKSSISELDQEREVEMEEIVNQPEKQNERNLVNERERAKSIEKPSWSKRPKTFFNVGGKKVQNRQKMIGGWWEKSSKQIQTMSVLSQGVNSLTVQAPKKTQKAMYERQQGQAQALNKEAEQYAQFYGQSFSRSDTMAQGTQQNIDYAMNILKSAADTITQTVTSMFRG
ncbi:MAG: hypothetical protein JJU12_04210 [Chlamydiales bacterium]|nr:hypothetical protein [Chlamydiales bacterium]